MPPSLRKACQACTKSKRRCVPQLPACERCAMKKIVCVYDLEPIVRSESPTQSQENAQNKGSMSYRSGELNIVYDSVETARDASMAAFASGQGLNSVAARPMLMSNGELTQWLLTFFSQVARDGLEGKSSPFVHPRIFWQQFSTSSYCVLPSQTYGTTQECWQLLRRLEGIHELTTRTLNRLLLEKPSNKKDAEVESLVVHLFSATQSLWTSAPKELSNTFNPWEAWVVAESVRRSMFAAIMIRGLWHAAAHGHVYYEPFFESMPFDPRADVWEARSSEEWWEAIRRNGGQHTRLKSYHEFITAMGPKLNPEEDGAFQRLLFVCYHGSNGLRILEGLHK